MEIWELSDVLFFFSFFFFLIHWLHFFLWCALCFSVRCTSQGPPWSVWMETMRWNRASATRDTPSYRNTTLRRSSLCHHIDAKYVTSHSPLHFFFLFCHHHQITWKQSQLSVLKYSCSVRSHFTGKIPKPTLFSWMNHFLLATTG